MHKKINLIIFVITFLILFSDTVSAGLEWAKRPVDFCVGKQIISGDENGDLMLESNITKEQMAKILVQSYSLKTRMPKLFLDVDESMWSYKYICDFSGCLLKKSLIFEPEKFVTREEFLTYLLIAAGYPPYDDETNRLLQISFSDSDEIDEVYKPYILTAVKNDFLKGSDMKINPKGLLTRAEACAFIFRVMNTSNNTSHEIRISSPDVPVNIQAPAAGNNGTQISQNTYTQTAQNTYQSEYTSGFSIMGESTITLEQAKKWAQSCNSHQRFIDIADLYWYYGSITGIRPEVLYAQAAKETNYGKYTGNVVPEQNNWAGIKAKGKNGDTTYDHESFAAPEDGVRAHFNHMAAYIGIEPVGVPHGRYESVKSLPWAGTVRYVEELGGKWAPYEDYGTSIVHDFIEPMQNTK